MPRDPWLNLAVTGHIRIVGDSAVAVFTRLLDGVEPSLVDEVLVWV
jgi:metal-dependent HD superfamily phosphatase/phosphodiesterase